MSFSLLAVAPLLLASSALRFPPVRFDMGSGLLGLLRKFYRLLAGVWLHHALAAWAAGRLPVPHVPLSF
ncbi:MAG: hypothetical protein AAFZ17_01445 [Cyanobacteria bacterium J06650_10]